jgi:hypothetical protein
VDYPLDKYPEHHMQQFVLTHPTFFYFNFKNKGSKFQKTWTWYKKKKDELEINSSLNRFMKYQKKKRFVKKCKK